MLCGAERDLLGQDPPSKDTSWKAPGDLAGRRSMGSCYINQEQKSIRLPLVTPANKQRKFHSKKKKTDLELGLNWIYRPVSLSPSVTLI